MVPFSLKSALILHFVCTDTTAPHVLTNSREERLRTECTTCKGGTNGLPVQIDHGSEWVQHLIVEVNAVSSGDNSVPMPPQIHEDVGAETAAMDLNANGQSTSWHQCQDPDSDGGHFMQLATPLVAQSRRVPKSFTFAGQSNQQSSLERGPLPLHASIPSDGTELRCQLNGVRLSKTAQQQKSNRGCNVPEALKDGPPSKQDEHLTEDAVGGLQLVSIRKAIAQAVLSDRKISTVVPKCFLSRARRASKIANRIRAAQRRHAQLSVQADNGVDGVSELATALDAGARQQEEGSSKGRSSQPIKDGCHRLDCARMMTQPSPVTGCKRHGNSSKMDGTCEVSRGLKRLRSEDAGHQIEKRRLLEASGPHVSNFEQPFTEGDRQTGRIPGTEVSALAERWWPVKAKSNKHILQKQQINKFHAKGKRARGDGKGGAFAQPSGLMSFHCRHKAKTANGDQGTAMQIQNLWGPKCSTVKDCERKESKGVSKPCVGGEIRFPNSDHQTKVHKTADYEFTDKALLLVPDQMHSPGANSHWQGYRPRLKRPRPQTTQEKQPSPKLPLQESEAFDNGGLHGELSFAQWGPDHRCGIKTKSTPNWEAGTGVSEASDAATSGPDAYPYKVLFAICIDIVLVG